MVGKPTAVFGEWMQHATLYGHGAHGAFFRRHLHELDAVIDRANELFAAVGMYSVQQKRWRFRNGATLIFRHVDNVQDTDLYKSQSFTRLYGEELADWPDWRPWFRLRGTLRSARGVPCKSISTGNPGGPGQDWVKRCYIDPSPDGYRLINEPFMDIAAWERVYIPSSLWDNQILVANDPSYADRLKSVGSEALVRAWLYRDWSAVEGAYFTDFSISRHVVDARVNADWLFFRALDWGSESPFSVHWYAVSDGTGEYPKEAIVVVKEWYERGARLSAEQFARGILERTDRYQAYTEADPSIFRQDGGPSIAERMAAEGCICVPADNTRIAGWDQVRQRLIGIDGRPMLYIDRSCVNLIRELGTAQHDQRKIEDVDTAGDDHAIDDLRYACMSRPWVKAPMVQKPAGLTFEEVIRGVNRRRRVNL